MRIPAFIFLILISLNSIAQKKTATVSGRIIDENEKLLSDVSITILGNQQGVISSDSGTFQIIVPAEKAFALIFTHAGFHTQQKNFLLNNQEKEFVSIKLINAGKTLETVIIKDETERIETGLIKVNPKSAITLPSATGGVEGLIKILVGSNNELTSQYSVRGGNYDENLIYVNDFEIYRPYLVRNGQQEGLSFINHEMVKNIHFYNGGFQAKYGDKISSVLDIEYKQPKSFSGSAYISLLEQGVHSEGISKNKQFSWMIGARSKTSRSLLGSQETKGNYQPSSSDIQALLMWKLSPKNHLEILGIASGSKFSLVPESAKKSSAVFSPLFTANIGLDIFFEGQEKDSYNSNLIGLSFVQNVNSQLKLKWMASRFGDKENEHFDITGAYLFGERSFDKSKPEFGQIVNPLGAGIFQNFARNELNIEVYNISHKGNYKQGAHFYQWGAGVDHTVISDKLNEWEYIDSAGYSLPYNPNGIHLSKLLKSTADIRVQKFSGYFQDNIRL
ncbi:MAG: carboxypeptidase-like regulatory domain-containing protein [Ginsengibacter sp.]